MQLEIYWERWRTLSCGAKWVLPPYRGRNKLGKCVSFNPDCWGFTVDVSQALMCVYVANIWVVLGLIPSPIVQMKNQRKAKELSGNKTQHVQYFVKVSVKILRTPCVLLGVLFSLCVYEQVWDDGLEKSATYWAEQCQWEHGPNDLLMSIGQNLAVHWGRYELKVTSRTRC